ncbi:MAG: hypothetical protein AAF810_06240 [Cyanobacteria bacterium P01_D01_bin.36]
MFLMLQCVFRVRYLGAIALLGAVIALGNFNRSANQAGVAVALVAGGATVATAVQKRYLQDSEQLQKENYLAELRELESHVHGTYEQREASLQTFLEMSMTEAEMLKGKIAKMHETAASDQLEKIALLGALETLEDEYSHLLYELQGSAIAETTLLAYAAHTQSISQSEIRRIQLEAQSRIAQLETALAQKTKMAAQMLTELETEATGTFNQFNAKVASQNERIESLHRQVESLNRANAELTRSRMTLSQ